MVPGLFDKQARRQLVRGGNSVQKVDAGVPQGSLTGPILFLLYTNDLPSHLDCKIVSYADDSQILVASKVCEVPKMIASLELNLSHSHLESWYHANCLQLNASKTQFVIFCSRQMQRQLPEVVLSLGDTEITSTLSLRNLGVTMDSNLTCTCACGPSMWVRQHKNVTRSFFHWSNTCNHYRNQY